MHRNFYPKLIAITDSYHLNIYEAEGIKLTSGPNKIELDFTHHERHNKNHGSYDKISGHNLSESQPHHTPKEIDQEKSARIICEYLKKAFDENEDYHELIIAAEPRMLGHIRKHLSKKLKDKLSREVHKDLMDLDKDSIEKIIFSE